LTRRAATGWFLAGLLLVATGCFDPKIQSGAFTCHPPDHPQCPDGQQCVGGYCVQPGSTVPTPSENDLAAAATEPDLAPVGPTTPTMDLRQPPPAADLSAAAAPDLSRQHPDLSIAHDMATPTCVGPRGDCTYHQNSVCCSNYCIYSTNTCR
jgi:hypothetical protein